MHTRTHTTKHTRTHAHINAHALPHWHEKRRDTYAHIDTETLEHSLRHRLGCKRHRDTKAHQQRHTQAGPVIQAFACRTQIILCSSPHGSYLVPRFLFSGPFPLFPKSLPLPFFQFLHFELRAIHSHLSLRYHHWRVATYVRVCWGKNLCLEDNLNIHEKMINRFNSFTLTHLLVKTRATASRYWFLWHSSQQPLFKWRTHSRRDKFLNQK